MVRGGRISQVTVLTTGDGIFGGAVVLGLVWLYVVTRDRWRWKRILRNAGLALTLPVVGLVGWLGYLKWDESRPRVEASFWGISMKASLDEVTFSKGKPTHIVEHSCETGMAPCPLWVYEEDSKAHLVKFLKGKVRMVEAITATGREYSLPSLQGLSNFSKPSDVNDRFGAPDATSVMHDKTRRLESFGTYGVFFSYEKDRVVTLGVYDPALGPMQYRYQSAALQ